MSRYVNADMICLAADETISETTSSTLIAIAQGVKDMVNRMNGIEIVRCRECKKANTEDCSHSYWDDDWGEWRVGYKGDDWFCADGEREGE